MNSTIQVDIIHYTVAITIYQYSLNICLNDISNKPSSCPHYINPYNTILINLNHMPRKTLEGLDGPVLVVSYSAVMVAIKPHCW